MRAFERRAKAGAAARNVLRTDGIAISQKHVCHRNIRPVPDILDEAVNQCRVIVHPHLSLSRYTTYLGRLGGRTSPAQSRRGRQAVQPVTILTFFRYMSKNTYRVGRERWSGPDGL